MTTMHPSRPVLDCPGDAPAVDFTVLDALIADLGDAGEGMRPMLWQSYLQEGEPLVAGLVAAATRGDFDAVRSAAHQLKSSSALLGVRPLAALLQRTEDLARAGSLGLVAITASVEAEYRRVAAAVDVAQAATS